MTTRTEQDFADRGVQIGSVFLMQPAVAIEFVKHCRSKGIKVFGVEGFLRVDGRIQPHQEHSCDCEAADDSGYEFTIGFLSKRIETEFWFEVVTDEPVE